MPRRLAITLLLFAVILGGAFLRYAPPSPRGLEAAPAAFSAARARIVPQAIAGNGTSRAVGTEGNAAGRAYLEAELTKIGFTTELQRATSCRRAACARVSNIVATRAGREAEAAPVLLMAHYDSVPCGPGASDDGAGTAAAIEAARAIGASPPLRRTVVVVLTDGEEPGLLGAEAFVREHPLARKIHGAINVDARGSAGPSTMFETSAGNAWLVGQLARHAERPVTSSLFYEIYRRMPNDTDFTTVKPMVHGMSFANIGGVEHYHTPLDSLEHADLGTLQHHGDQALAMVRAFADAGPELDAPRDTAGDAVWFDVLALFIVRWPASASLGLALAALALVSGWTVRRRAWGIGLLTPGATLLAALLASLVVGGALKWLGAIPVPWVAHPLPALVSLHVACMAAGLAVARLLGRGSNAQVMWAGTWLTWGALGVATAIAMPGASFLFVVPTVLAGLFAWLRIDRAAAVPACAAAVLWMPLAWLVYDGLGLVVPVLASVSSALLVTTLPALALPSSASSAAEPSMRRVGAAAASIVALAILVASVVPKYSADRPQRVNVVFRQDVLADGTSPPARVHVEAAWGGMTWGAPPEAMLRVLGDPAKLQASVPTPWSALAPFAQAPRVALEAPVATVLETTSTDTSRRVRVRIQSRRGATTVGVVLPPSRRPTVEVEGQPAFPDEGTVVLRAVPDEGFVIAIAADGRAPIALTLLDITPGPPPAGAELARAVLAARPPEATQTQEGDVTVVARHLEL